MSTRNWRTSDLRGTEAAPSSVVAVVRHVRFGLTVARWGESALFVATGLCVTLSAAALSGVPLARVDAWIVAALGALACGGAWRLEHRVRADDVARRMDHRLRHQGGLVTAYELECRGENGPLARLLYGRVLHRLRRAEALRALLPPLGLPVAAPLLGAALLALAIEASRPEPEDQNLHAVATGLTAELDRMWSNAIEAEGPTLDTARDLRELVVSARELERGLGQEDPVRALAEIERIDRELAELAAKSPLAAELSASLSAARSWADAARMGLSESAKGTGDAEPPGDVPGADVAKAGVAKADVDGTGASARLTPDGGEGTIAGSISQEPSAGAAEGAGADGDHPSEAGTTSGSWWPARYDDVVHRWIESRRRTLDPPATEPTRRGSVPPSD
ncbi:MAG: hypothetical protein O7B99_00310 [Planctomycetota bacterium]|nr:hypothetical protein [Planctomycetota bacterium]